MGKNDVASIPVPKFGFDQIQIGFIPSVIQDQRHIGDLGFQKSDHAGGEQIIRIHHDDPVAPVDPCRKRGEKRGLGSG